MIWGPLGCEPPGQEGPKGKKGGGGVRLHAPKCINPQRFHKVLLRHIRKYRMQTSDTRIGKEDV